MLAIDNLKNKIKICPQCFKSFEPFDPSASFRAGAAQGRENVCSICSDNSRDKSKICIVEKEVDLETIENTHRYKGLYFILGGVLGALEKNKPELEERLENLINQIEKEKPAEIILALNPTQEGKKTTLFIKRKLAPTSISLTELAIGLPLGGELEYADEDTIVSALNNRK